MVWNMDIKDTLSLVSRSLLWISEMPADIRSVAAIYVVTLSHKKNTALRPYEKTINA